MDPPGSAGEAAAVRQRARRAELLSRWRGRGLGSIQTKLLLMLLLTSIISTLVVGLFGYRSGTESLRKATYARLTEVGDERLRAVQDFAANQRGAVVLDSQGVGVAAARAFASGYDELSDATTSPEQQARLASYYGKTFVPRLERATGENYDPAGFEPSGGAAAYLQANYTAYAADFDQVVKRDDAGDGSAWSAANKRFQPYFREAVASLGLDDALILDKNGNVVWSAYKGAELGTNVVTGDFRGGGLQEVYQKALRSNTLDYVAVADFESYLPSYGSPTMFIASPIGTEADLSGVLVYEVSSQKINDVLSGREGDAQFTGLAKSGDVNLFGADGIMRSDSRLLIQDPKQFRKDAIASGHSAELVDRMITTKRSMLLLRDRSKPAALARQGKSGVMRTDDYLGRDVLAAYQPADLPGLDWTMVTEISADEALAPVSDFARNIALATALVVLLVCAASVLLARVFTQPVQRLVHGVRAVASGHLGAQVAAGKRRDEFGDLELAFNDMSSSLREKQELLETQQEENRRMLGAMMPASVAERYRGGEQDIATEHEDVSVIYVQVEGFDEFVAGQPPAEALTLLNTLARGFDDAARATGIERVRSMGTSYVATSGLVVQRVDHARRVVDFALGVADMVRRFNHQHGSQLAVRAGGSSGQVNSGLVGRKDVVYDLWGETVDLAHRARAHTSRPGIYVTQGLKDKLGSGFSFAQAGTITEDRQTVEIWQVLVEDGRSGESAPAAPRARSAPRRTTKKAAARKAAESPAGEDKP